MFERKFLGRAIILSNVLLKKSFQNINSSPLKLQNKKQNVNNKHFNKKTLKTFQKYNTFEIIPLEPQKTRIMYVFSLKKKT